MGNLAITLRRKLPELKRLFEKEPLVLGVWLFGSQADGTANEWSDVDLAVLYDREASWNEQMGFEVAICEILGTQDVDVVDLRRVNLELRHRALSGRLLYERDYVRVSDFLEETLVKYPDYAYALERFNEDYFEGMRQDYAKYRFKAHRRTSKNNRGKPKATRSATRTRA